MKKIIIGLFIFGSVPTMAQQQIMFTQYMFNGLALNPAYAGSHERLSLSFLTRHQWLGIDGAPSTQTFSAHTPLRNDKIGLGLLILRDKIGVTSQTGVYGSYSYRIPTGKGKLAFGLQGGFSSYKADLSTVSNVDPVFANRDVKELQPNAGIGLFYRTDKFYIGASIPQLLENEFDRDNLDSDSKLVRHYFTTFGFVFDINHNLKLKPSMLIKAVNGAPLEMDLNASLIINDVFWVGFSYRSFDSIDAILQVQITNQLQLGYSYDFITTTGLNRVNSGSHEIMLNYRVVFDKTKIITPRYF